MGMSVTLQSVSKRFGALDALKDVTLSVQHGEVVALLGPNGAGKTTAISIMLGLRNPSSGTATLLGRSPHDLQARSQCGVMLQESGVPMNLSVRELITLFRSYYPQPLSVATILTAAQLEARANAQAAALSGGQRQRLYFALAICANPDLLILDEPTAALDVESRHAFWEELREFAHAGKTILFTTHYIEEADALAERVVVINGGRIIADAAPATIKARITARHVSFDAPAFDAQMLVGLPLQQLQQVGEHISFSTPEPESILQSLFARGVVMQQLSVVSATLEDAVLQLTNNPQRM